MVKWPTSPLAVSASKTSFATPGHVVMSNRHHGLLTVSFRDTASMKARRVINVHIMCLLVSPPGGAALALADRKRQTPSRDLSAAAQACRFYFRKSLESRAVQGLPQANRLARSASDGTLSKRPKALRGTQPVCATQSSPAQMPSEASSFMP